MRDPADRSDFEWHVDLATNEVPVVAITDLSKGGMSVTNNIEAIVSRIDKALDVDGSTVLWIYRDSEGIYDGYDPVIRFIYPLGASSEDVAVTAARRRSG